ncbi:hypothetical protein DL766_005342 [Monosporascus sp. MC13-8B]|nr:hypothetical protein DL763_003726 [Monosporascus cannonballus]RYP29538.1 hypothetical protein DL766_005342 [Monosporascus sp. MC13-8B]
MSAPHTKRQFAGAASDPTQRQITSFFSSATGSSTSASSLSFSTSSSHTTRASQSFGSSLLPAPVQANLLSVGMRVRKSVPEGYKTGTYSAFALWDESDCAANMAGGAASSEGRSRANAFSSPRELLPFCGIHKVGGLDTQPETFSSYQTSISINDASPIAVEDDIPGLTSSQDSMASTDPTAPGFAGARTRKRSFTEEEDEAPDIPNRLNVWQNEKYEGEVSPRSLAPVGWGNTRVMAVPKKGKLRDKMGLRRETQFGSPGDGGKSFSHQNVMVVDDDFDEADFLDMGQSWEVEMGDV